MWYFIFGLVALSLGVIWWGQHFRHKAFENAYLERAAIPRDTGTDVADTATDPEPENRSAMEQIMEEDDCSSSSCYDQEDGFGRAFMV